jgi:DNA-binding transcriptional LysR family regulator
MDTEKLKTFLRAVDTGSFTKAAEELGYTPSGVTHMMNALEEDLGVVLLHRTRSGVSLTPAGEDLIEPIRELAAAADRMEQSVAELQGITVGHVLFASGGSFARYLVPDVVRRFKERYPQISLELTEDTGGTSLRQAVVDGRVSMAFLTRASTEEPGIPLCTDDILAVVPEGHPLAEKDSVTLEELAQYPYVGLKLDYDLDVQRLVEGSPLEKKSILVSHDEQTILAMVKEGLGVSVVAGMHVAFSSEGVVGIPFRPPCKRDCILLLNDRIKLSPAERKFVEVAQEVVAELIEDGIVDPPRI